MPKRWRRARSLSRQAKITGDERTLSAHNSQDSDESISGIPAHFVRKSVGIEDGVLKSPRTSKKRSVQRPKVRDKRR